MIPLPIDALLPELRNAFRRQPNVVLSADPGAGKTTRVPLALLKEEWLAGRKIIMLEPRRLAARRAAMYMAHTLGEKTGESVGYRIRGDSAIGKKTRLEVVTEGILTRLLQHDPSLPGYGLVIFDEFHERSIHADLGLALTLNVQEHLREDLHILVMSATLDRIAVSSLIGDAAILRSEGRAFPVATSYLERTPEGNIEPLVVTTILRALRDGQGDLLVFLPGQREIRRVGSLLAEMKGTPDESSIDNADVHMLFGDAPAEEQSAALTPAPRNRRKIILSTSIAETSLTIDGVTIVIDAGLARVAQFDPRRGMSGLTTRPVSRASADQRRGRAGRQAPGTCFRLWTEIQHHQLPEFSRPEILDADLAPLALEFARWGTPEGEGLRFLDPPPQAHLSQARQLLLGLGALDKDLKLTPHGRAIGELPIHPRYAHMLIRGKELGAGSLACDIAALLEERDILRGGASHDIDLHSRWHALGKGGARNNAAVERVRAQAARLRESISVGNSTRSDRQLGILLALAYPERVAKRREADSLRYQMSGGTGAIVPRGSALAREEYLAVGDVDGAGNEVKIFLAEPVTETDLQEAFTDQLTETDEIRWDGEEEAVVARSVTRFGAIELSERQLHPSGDQVRSVMIGGIRRMGLDSLPWNKHAVSVRTRSEWLRAAGVVSHDWPDLSEPHLMESLEEWLGPFLDGVSKKSHLRRLDLEAIISGKFSYKQLRELEFLAPTHLTVPTGSRIPLEYAPGADPVLAVRLQEMFGQTETPTVAGGRVKVLLHLLSPAHRPLAVTQDLPSFWQNAYQGVRKELRGRYLKHFWPENPLEAEPTKRTKRR